MFSMSSNTFSLDFSAPVSRKSHDHYLHRLDKDALSFLPINTSCMGQTMPSDQSLWLIDKDRRRQQ